MVLLLAPLPLRLHTRRIQIHLRHPGNQPHPPHQSNPARHRALSDGPEARNGGAHLLDCGADAAVPLPAVCVFQGGDILVREEHGAAGGAARGEGYGGCAGDRADADLERGEIESGGGGG